MAHQQVLEGGGLGAGLVDRQRAAALVDLVGARPSASR